MLLEPNTIVLYVHNLQQSSHFYQDLLGSTPGKASDTFHSFVLSNGMVLGLKAMHAVEPTTDKQNGNGELAFTVERPQDVDELFNTWQAKKITILLSPSALPYGYTFVALDPDGNRLRVASLDKKSS